MFVSTQQTIQPNIKAFRDEMTPGCVWLRLNSITLVCFEHHEAQKAIEEMTRELQAHAAYQASLGAQS